MAFLGAADRVAAMAAASSRAPGVALVVADDDDAVFADEGHEEVAGVGDLGVVAMKFQARAKIRSSSSW